MRKLLAVILILFVASPVLADPTLVPPERIDANFETLASDTITSKSDTAIRFGDTIDMQLFPILNLPAPTADSDAVRKRYVDDNFVRTQDDLYLPNDPADSDVFMQNFRILGLPSPTADTEAATKQYVDNNAGGGGTGDTTIDILDSQTFLGAFSVLDFDTNLSVTNSGGDTAIIEAASSSITGDSYLPDDPATSNVDMSGNDIQDVEIISVSGQSFIQFNTDNGNNEHQFQPDDIDNGMELVASSLDSQFFRFLSYDTVGIDGASLTGVDTPTNDFHAANKRYVDNQTGGSGSTRKRAHLPLVSVPSGDTASIYVNVPSGETFDLWEFGIQDTNNDSAPQNVLLKVVEMDNGQEISSLGATALKHEDNAGSPVGSATGATDIGIRIDNDSSNTVSVTAFAEYSIE